MERKRKNGEGGGEKAWGFHASKSYRGIFRRRSNIQSQSGGGAAAARSARTEAVRVATAVMEREKSVFVIGLIYYLRGGSAAMYYINFLNGAITRHK